VQNEITGRIALTLHLELVGVEAARAVERPDAMDYILRGRAASDRSPTRENYAEAVGWFERALSLDPASAEAKSLFGEHPRGSRARPNDWNIEGRLCAGGGVSA
jgi:hypothetical protein